MEIPSGLHPGADALAIAAGASLDEVFPGFDKAVPRLFGRTMQHAFPDEFRGWRKTVREFVAAADGPGTLAAYDRDGRRHVAFWIRCPDPDEAADLLPELFTIFLHISDSLAADGADALEAFSFEIDDEDTESGVPYLRVRFPERFRKRAGTSRKQDPVLERLPHSFLDMVPKLSACFASQEGYLVAVIGEAGEEEMEEALAAVDVEGESLWHSDSAREAVAGVGGGQYSVALLNLDRLFLEYAADALDKDKTLQRMLEEDRAKTETAVARLFKQMKANFVESGDVAAVAVGARNDAATLEFSISTKAASVLVHNSMLVRRVVERVEKEAPAAKKSSRPSVRANERNAVAALKAYATAQVAYDLTFDSGYADDLRVLLERELQGKPAAFVTEDLARARMGEACVPYKGYVFVEDPAVSDWEEDFGLFAYPLEYGVTSRRVFWIGSDAVVMRRDPQSAPGKTPSFYDAEDSPLNNFDDWEDM